MATSTPKSCHRACGDLIQTIQHHLRNVKNEEHEFPLQGLGAVIAEKVDLSADGENRAFLRPMTEAEAVTYTENIEPALYQLLDLYSLPDVR